MRCINKKKFQEELLVWQSPETTTYTVEIYNKLSNYFDNHRIFKPNIVSCVTDGSFSMMSQNTECLKLMKNHNSNMLVVYCVIHRKNLVAKNVAPKLHEILYCVIKCVNAIKANFKAECLFQKFCEANHADHVRLLLHMEVRWLLKRNCLKRFMELFEPLGEVLKDKSEVLFLMATDGTAHVSYLEDIFEKL